MAQKVGFKALYLSGAGVANFSYGLPDVGMTSLDNVLLDAERILSAVDLPLLVDGDTGWGSSYTIKRMISSMIRAGITAVHIEDQPFVKRCGHLSGKTLVPQEEMVDRIKAAVDARTDPSFVIMARTDAYGVEGLENAIKRAKAYVQAGADMIFPEALTSLEEFKEFKAAIKVPILANMTEFGKTPSFELKEWGDAHVDMILYPLSAARAMNKAAFEVYESIRAKGTQREVIDKMQTRNELYRFLDYHP
jgi:methylisocitrate lyase